MKKLESRILDKTDKILFRESVGCLESKFYRSGYIITWINIVESLKRKIYESSLSGNKEASIVIGKIENVEKRNGAADKMIIESSKNLNFIEEDDYNKLEYFWNQRCIFAHPYEKEPTEIELRMIIEQSVEIVLSKPVLFKKNYIDELVNNIVTMPHFLGRDTSEIINYASKIIPRIDTKLHPYFFKSLYYQLSLLLNDPIRNPYEERIKCFISVLFSNASLPLNSPEWRLEEFTLNNPLVALNSYINVDLWAKLPKRVKDIIVEYVVQYKEEPAAYNARKIFHINIVSNNILEDEYMIKYNKSLESVPFWESSDYYMDNNLLFNRVISELLSPIFTRQNSAVKFIISDKGKEFTQIISNEMKAAIGRHITYAANHNSWDAIEAINTKYKEINNELVFGFLVGSFIDCDNKIYILKDYILKSIIRVDELEENFIEERFKEFVELIKTMEFIYKNIYDKDEIHAIFKGLLELNNTVLKDVTLKGISDLKSVLLKKVDLN